MPEKSGKRPLRVLFVEDREDDADLTILELNRAGFAVTSQRVETVDDMLASLESSEWDIILSDHSMPHFSSEGVLGLLQRTGCDVPCIIVSGAIGEESAVAAMRNGAADYILKDSLARLGPAIERELREAEVRRKRRQAEAMVEKMAYYDPLTGLPNRTLFRDRFAQGLVRARRNHKMIAVMFMDLDRFKNVNDTLGHSIGDRILQCVGDRLVNCVREDDTVSRWGGDEFTMLFPDIERIEDVSRLTRKMLEAIKQPLVIDDHEFVLTASIGVALCPADGDDVDTLLRNADTAMYRVKDQSRDGYQMYTRAMNARAMERLALETSLRYARERKELVLYYQPQVDVRTEELVGMEALIRWRHPELGLIAPAQFLPLAGEAGLMGAIGAWVLEEACTQAKAWQDAGLPPIRMAVNLSAQQFQYRNLVQDIDQILKQTRLHPRFLDLEVTEGVAMSPSSSTIPVLRDLKAMGVQTSVDDFGTGYSSLASLNRFEFDRLKIDKAFIRDITTSIEDLAIASMVIALAKSLNRRSLAEGVETVEQLEMLRSRSCDEAQGFLFSPPVPAEEAKEFIRRSRCGWAFHAKPVTVARPPLQLRERHSAILD